MIFSLFFFRGKRFKNKHRAKPRYLQEDGLQLPAVLAAAAGDVPGEEDLVGWHAGVRDALVSLQHPDHYIGQAVLGLENTKAVVSDREGVRRTSASAAEGCGRLESSHAPSPAADPSPWSETSRPKSHLGSSRSHLGLARAEQL